MDYIVERCALDGMLTIRVSGDYRRPKDSYILMDVMLEAIQGMGAGRILLDMREANILSGPVDAYLLGMEPRKQDIDPRSFRLAAVYSSLLAETEILESVLKEGGFVFRAFCDVDQALTWLDG